MSDPTGYAIEVRAAVIREQGGPVTVEPIRLQRVGERDVRVRISLTGVCHSDLSLARGPLSQSMPAVLGHEATGVVIEAGDAVTSARLGQRVILLWIAPCGHCFYCRRQESYLCEAAGVRARDPYAIDRDGNPVWAGLGVGSFAEEVVLPENAVMPVPDFVTDVQAALLGCAVTTGVGAVQNAARVPEGASVLVIGLGGVGMSVVQGARLAGATTIVGIDTVAEKANQARHFGATHFLDANAEDLKRAVRSLTDGRGVDFAFDCVGSSVTTRLGWDSTRRGGTTCVVGIGARDDKVAFNALELFHQARTLVGTVAGSHNPLSDFDAFFAWTQSGRLDLDAMVSDTTSLAGIDQAFDLLVRGEGLRTLIDPHLPS